MRLTPNFTLAQLVHSETAASRGIDNIPPAEIIDNLAVLAQGLEQVRTLLGHTLDISSGYRSPELNGIVGGSKASQHVLGLAADFICPAFGTPLEVARAIRDSGIAFDQMILEHHEWVHISFSPAPRCRVMTILDAEAGYLLGLRDEKGNPVA